MPTKNNTFYIILEKMLHSKYPNPNPYIRLRNGVFRFLLAQSYMYVAQLSIAEYQDQNAF